MLVLAFGGVLFGDIASDSDVWSQSPREGSERTTEVLQISNLSKTKPTGEFDQYMRNLIGKNPKSLIK